ncbi:hypothetical protein [Bradyrhizobium canariense]|uniref:hypothetical protein n=1 Tax=Bradyrhizobium canariense TaxID=255045 RepID=UPI0014301BA8|nr:hypothetical protein [Bradyrhizobium canariense]
MTALQREVADDRLKRLYLLVKEGMTKMDDVLKDRLNNLQSLIDVIEVEWRAQRASNS